MAEKKAAPGQKSTLIGMLIMGIFSLWLTVKYGESYHGADWLTDVILKSYIGICPGDLFILSFSYVPLMIVAALLRDAGIGFEVMALKTPYNVVMTIFSAYCFVNMALWRFGPDFKGETDDLCGSALRHVSSINGTEIGTFKRTAALFFWSKYIEWIDSVFLLYTYKPIIVLHGFHHLGAPVAMGLMVFADVEFVWIFVLWNSLIHTVMYFYYGCSGVGIKLRFIRPWLTSMQIAQFVTGMSYLWVAYNGAYLPGGKCVEGAGTAPGGGPVASFSFIYQYVYVMAVLGLFTNFFIGEYLKPKAPKEKNQKKMK